MPKELTLKTEPKSAAFIRPDVSTLIAARAKNIRNYAHICHFRQEKFSSQI
jgi:hypothetical protein